MLQKIYRRSAAPRYVHKINTPVNKINYDKCNNNNCLTLAQKKKFTITRCAVSESNGKEGKGRRRLIWSIYSIYKQ